MASPKQGEEQSAPTPQKQTPFQMRTQPRQDQGTMVHSKKSQVSRKRQNVSPVPPDGSIFRPRQSTKTGQRVVRGGSFDGGQRSVLNGSGTRSRSRYLTRQSVSLAKRGSSGKTVWLGRTRSSEEMMDVKYGYEDDEDEYSNPSSAKLALHASFDAGLLNYNDSSHTIIEEEMAHEGMGRGSSHGDRTVDFKFGEPFEEWNKKHKSCKKVGNRDILEHRGNESNRNHLENNKLSKETDSQSSFYSRTKDTSKADSLFPKKDATLKAKQSATTPNIKGQRINHEWAGTAAYSSNRTPFVSRSMNQNMSKKENPNDFVTPHNRSKTDAVAPFSLNRKDNLSTSTTITSSILPITNSSHSRAATERGKRNDSSAFRISTGTTEIRNNRTDSSTSTVKHCNSILRKSGECRYSESDLANDKTKMDPTNSLETPYRQSSVARSRTPCQGSKPATCYLKERKDIHRDESSDIPPPSSSSSQPLFSTPYPSFHSGLPPLTPTRPMLHSLQSTNSFTPHPQKLQMNSAALSHRTLDCKAPSHSTGTISALHLQGGLPENAPDSNNSNESQHSSSSATPFRFSTFPASLPRVQPKSNASSNLDSSYNPSQTPTQLQFQPQTPQPSRILHGEVDVDSSREELNSHNTSLSSLSVEGPRNIAIGGESSLPSPLSPFLFKDGSTSTNSQPLFSPQLRMRIPAPESHDTSRAVWLSPVVRDSNDAGHEEPLQDSEVVDVVAGGKEGAVRTRLNFSSSFSPEGFRVLLDETNEGTLNIIFSNLST